MKTSLLLLCSLTVLVSGKDRTGLYFVYTYLSLITSDQWFPPLTEIAAGKKIQLLD